MSSYAFNDIANTTLASFNPETDTLNFVSGYTATGLLLNQSGADTLVTYGGSSVRLSNVSAAGLDGSQLVFADGSLYRQGTSGSDTIVGSVQADQFQISAGGSDNISAGADNDVIFVDAALDAADSIDGGSGTADELCIAGNYAGYVQLSSTTVTHVEKFTFGAGGTVRLQLNDAAIATADYSVSFDATAQGQSDALYLDGSLTSYGNNVTSGSGNDSLVGGSGGDYLSGGIGGDTLVGGAGNDTLAGGLDGDVLTGGAGNDRFVFNLGNPRTDSSPTTIDAITDFETGDLIDLPGVNSINGKALVFNVDSLNFNYTGGNSGTQDSVNANDGFADVYWRNNATDGRLEIWVDGNDDGLFSETDLLIYLPNGGTGKASLAFSDFADNFVAWRGTPGDDSYVGNNANNEAYALGGNDTLDGTPGNDSLYGGSGNDSVDGGIGGDQLFGGSGADTLNGGDDGDYLHAEGYDKPGSSATDATGTLNVLHGGAGDDYLYGGAGNDSLDGGTENDSLTGGAGNDTLLGGDGADSLSGSEGSDQLDGGAGNDTLRTGSSTVRGAEVDTLSGGDGDDLLVATNDYGADRSVLTGGLGADRFWFASTDPSYYSYTNLAYGYYGNFTTVAAPDRITDFNAAEGDLIGTGITAGVTNSKPVVWRGTANAGFTAAVGQSMADAGADPNDTRFLEFWTFYDGGSDRTVLFMDRNRDFAVDSSDLRLEFDGNVALDTGSFSAGTFSVKVGTAGADADTSPALAASADLAFGLGGDDTLSGLDGNDTLNGDGGNDVLVGGLGNDFIYGGAGGDSIDGGAGYDQLYGGSGADTLNGGDDADTLYADHYEDSTGDWNSGIDAAGTVNVLNGGAGDDNLQGGDGDDQLNGEADNDYLYGGAGNDSLDGGDGADTLHGSDGSDQLFGGAGNDALYVDSSYGVARGTNMDTLAGGDGDDVFRTSYDYATDRAVMTGGQGADKFVYNAESYYVYQNLTSNNYSPVSAPDRITDFSAAGGDLIDTGISTGLGGSYSNIPLVWRGTANAGFTATVGQSMADAGSDATGARFLEFWTFYDGGADRTVLFMDRNRDFAVDSSDLRLEFDGNVTLGPEIFTTGSVAATPGSGAADTNTELPASAGYDLLLGGKGNDTFSGLGGNDYLSGNAGDDVLGGDGGADNIFGGADNDSLDGGDGNDMLYGGTGSDTLHGGLGNDIVYAGQSQDFNDGSTQDAAGTFNLLVGDEGADQLYGGAGNDELHGGGDDDYLYGYAGNDTLLGEGNNDVLNGDDGDDFIDGGAGIDTIYGGVGNDRMVYDANDTTVDGSSGTDVLVLTSLVTVDLGNTSDQVSDGGTTTGFEGVDFSALTAGVNFGGDTNGNVLVGTAYADSFEGLGDNDTLIGGAGNDTLDGGSGGDTARYSGNQADYTIVASGSDYIITDNVGGRDGSDALIGIERLQFADANVPVVNTPPTLAVPSAPTFADTAVDDTFTASTDTLVGGDVDGDPLAYGIEGGAVNAGVSSLVGSYGTLSVNTGTGAWSFAPNDGAIEGLKGDTSENFTVTVSDGSAGASQTLTVNLTGANDAPVITRPASDLTIVEDGPSVQPFAGLSITDIDDANLQSVTFLIEGWQPVGDFLSVADAPGMSLNIDAIEGRLSASFTGPTTIANFVTTLRGISIGTSTDALAGDRIVRLTVSDGLATTELTPFTVTTQAINDLATATVTPAGSLTLQAGDSLNPYASITLNDADGTTILTSATITLVGGAAGDLLTLDTGSSGIVSDFSGGTLTLSGTASLTAYQAVLGTLSFQGTAPGLRTLELRVDDGNGPGDASVVGLTVEMPAVVGLMVVGDGQDNQLSGGAGNDTLLGGGGNDLLNGGRGADQMEGATGNDIYVVDHRYDRIIELADSGVDSVSAKVSHVLTDHVENLFLTGSVTVRSGSFFSRKTTTVDLGIDGTGNEADNLLRGNGGHNALDGLGGNDTLLGGGGADILRGGAGADRLVGGSGADSFVFAAGDGGSTLAGADILYDFELGIDRIALAGLAFDDLSISQGNGSDTATGNTVIASNGEFLAVLLNVQTLSITASQFVPWGA